MRADLKGMIALSTVLVLSVPAAAVAVSRRRARRTTAAVLGGQRRDFFGDGVAAVRRHDMA